jgi:formylglycine-generating enzyme required for sulfatase activity
MTEAKRPLKVFLCHAHSDKDAVKALYTHLTNDGVDAWLDKEKLLPGTDWENEIRRAVRESDVVVVCHSKQFNQRGFRQNEVKIALEEADMLPKGEIFIIPARLEECDVLDDLKRYHWVDLFEDDGYEMLMRAFRRRADKIGATLQIKKSWLPKITTPRRKETIIPEKNESKAPPPQANKPTSEKNQSRKTVFPRKTNTAIVVAMIGLVGTLGAALISSPLLANIFERTPEPTTVVSTPTNTKMPLPSATRQPATPTFTSTSVPFTSTSVPPTFTPTPGIGSFIESDGVVMMFVPASPFFMGSDRYSDEQPIHAIHLSAYYIDKYEVTNAAYGRCVDAGACVLPKQSRSYTRIAYYGNPEFDEFPVIYVDWNMAKTYCEWRGDRLPTEAEWEKAARGTDGRTYPWGESVSCDKANYQSNCKGDTTQVGSYLGGVSPYGLYDMAGNVWEWTSSLYKPYPYSADDGRENLNASGMRAPRGGSWNNYGFNVRSAYRYRLAPDYINYNVGIRCAKDAP